MRKKKIVRLMIRIVLDILIATLLLCFLFSLYWYVNGSFELVPTEEQQEKVQAVSMLSMVMCGVPCITCIAVRVKCKKWLCC